MFENLTDRLGHTLKQLRGQGRLTEDNIRQAMREVRMALLEADVALPVVKQFIDEVKEQAVGEEVLQSLTPGQALVAVVQREMVKLLGDEHAGLDLKAQPPAVVLMAGLQGSGKTTSTGKLARYLKESQKKNVLVVSADVYRPAAIEQLRTVAQSVGVDFHPSAAEDKPADIARAALEKARKGFYDVLIVDTAGRLSIDEAMMQEIKQLHGILDPADTLFVVDSMTGQDAANTAKAFGDALPLT
ncbi:MAG: signal recognition particle receptor subunit alpha, partial [Nevskiales bacterium]